LIKASEQSTETPTQRTTDNAQDQADLFF